MKYDKINNDHRYGLLSKPIKIILLVSILLSIVYFLFPRFLPSVFAIVARPFWNIPRIVKNGEEFVSVSNLIKENEELKKKIEENESKYYFLDFIQEENKHLKEIMGRNQSDNSILAKIIKKPPFSAYDTIIIDIGGSHGIENGDKVYALGDIILGEIVEVGIYTSKIKLYSSYGEKFNVFVGNNNIETIAYGMGGGIFFAELPRDTEVTIGDIVSVPDMVDSFAGKVYEISEEPSKPFEKIFIKQPINIYELKWLIIRK